MAPRILLALMLAWGPMTQWGPANQPDQWDSNHARAMEAARRERRAAVLYFTLPDVAQAQAPAPRTQA